MSKFKVGDMVKIVHTDYSWCGLDVGTVHEVVNIHGGGVNLMGHYDHGDSHCLYFSDYELEPVNQTNTLVVGGKYTSKNGRKWECIAVRGDTAWLASSYDGGLYGAAYQFKTDGENISQDGGNFDIDFPPREEWIDTRFSVATADHEARDGAANHVARIRFKLVDGKPDWSTAEVSGD
jgi:hypothetical protein